MKPLCPLRFEGRSDCSCGENHEKLREYGMEMKRRVGERVSGLSRGETLNRLLRAGVPALVCGSLRDLTWKPTKALEAAYAFMRNKEHESLLLSGAPGCGKSFAAAWCLFELARTFPWDTRHAIEQEPISYVDAVEITSSTLSTPALDAKLAQLKTAKLVVVDDLPDDGTPIGRQRMSAMLADRLNRKRPTIITCNLRPGVLADKYGAHVQDRLEPGMHPVLDTKSIRSGREWAKAGRAV